MFNAENRTTRKPSNDSTKTAKAKIEFHPTGERRHLKLKVCNLEFIQK